MDVCSATLGHVKQHMGSHLPDREARFTLTRGGVHTGHQDVHSVGHKAVHSAAPGCAHRDMGMRTVLHRDTPARLHLGTCTPESVSVRPLPAPRVPLPRGGARRPAGVSYWLSGLSAGRSDRGGPGLARRVPAGRGR